MNEEVDCKVLSASSVHELNGYIKELGNEWEPVGGVSVAVATYGASQVTVYAQTMQRLPRHESIECCREVKVVNLEESSFVTDLEESSLAGLY